ncbi:MAG: PQQ-binding-like beta-propeller repeat protein [Methylobacter sp.]|jgi:outer membrane protein assembly factor BamB
MKRFNIKPGFRNVFLIMASGLVIGLVICAIALAVTLRFKTRPVVFKVVEPVAQTSNFLVVVTSTQATTSTEVVAWNPEIATNEYWDYGTLNNLKLYVNNTDRSVIYALDPQTGKIVWTVWGKDYGINGFEIRMSHDHLFISSSTGDKDYAGLWVFDKNGRLAWNHPFLGYLDMPQMLFIPEDKVVIESRSDTDSCLKGCGILCKGTKPPESWCTTHELWAFDLNTGKVMWVNRTATLYNMYLGLDEANNITASGGGWGGFNHAYTLDPKTGEVLTHVATLEENGINNLKLFEYNQNAQTVSYVYNQYPARVVKWQLKPGDGLYKLVSEHADYNKLRFLALENTLLVIETLENGSNLTYGVDAKNGKILWSADLDSGRYSLSHARENGDVLLLDLEYISTCKKECDTCVSWICVDTEPTKECKACETKEQSAPDYSPSQIWSVNRQDGSINWKWHYGKNRISLQSIDAEKGMALVLVNFDTKEYRVINLKTGEDRAATPEELPKEEEGGR